MKVKMKEYKIYAVLWEDHTIVTSAPLPKNPNEVVIPTLSIGLLADETEKVLVLVSNVERYERGAECDYLIIYKGSVLNIQQYGTIKLRNIKK